MKTIFLTAWCVLVLGGCQSPKVESKAGTELTTDSAGHQRLTTYVTLEQYQRLTPDERERIHAQVGLEARESWGADEINRSTLSTDELNKALAADAAQRASGQK